MKRFLLLPLIVFLFISINGHCKEKMRIAVMDLQAKGVSKPVATAVSNMIRSDMVDIGLFTIIERNQMKEILKEQELQITGCTDNACAVEVGKLLSARKILVGELTKFEDLYLITVRIVDVEKGVAEFAARVKADSNKMLDQAVSQLTRKLIGRITGQTHSDIITSFQKKTIGGYYARSIVPGFGHFYSGHDTKGYFFLGTFIGAVSFTTYSLINYSLKRGDYENMTSGSEADFKSAHDASVNASNLANISFAVLGVIYLANWVDVLFLTKPGFIRSGSSMGLKNSKNTYIGFNMQYQCFGVQGFNRERYYDISISKKF